MFVRTGKCPGLATGCLSGFVSERELVLEQGRLSGGFNGDVFQRIHLATRRLSGLVNAEGRGAFVPRGYPGGT